MAMVRTSQGRALTISLVAQMVKNLPSMQETRLRSLGLEDTLEKEMATHSSILAWRIPWTEEPGCMTVHKGHKESSFLKLSRVGLYF